MLAHTHFAVSVKQEYNYNNYRSIMLFLMISQCFSRIYEGVDVCMVYVFEQIRLHPTCIMRVLVFQNHTFSPTLQANYSF